MIRRLKLVDDSTDAPMEAGLLVAFASDDMRHVNQHFGSAAAFVVHAVDAREHRMVEVVQFTGRSARDGNEGKLAARLSAAEGCDAVYAEAIGPSAKTQLAERNVQGLCVPTGTPIPDILNTLMATLRGETRAPAGAVPRRRQDPGRFERMEAEGWTE